MSDFSQSSGPAPSNIVLTAEEKKVFGQLFAQADTQNLGVITGEIAVKFFEKSGLKPLTLGEIWGIADTENRGLLTKLGFSVALRLIGQAQNGQQPRAELAQHPGPMPTFKGALGAFPSSPPTPQQPQPAPQVPTSPIQQQLSGNAVLVPRLVPEDVARFTDLFEKSGAVDGVLPGDLAREIFQKAKLPNSTLGVIWSLSDRQERGALSAGEFVVAMHLIQCTMNGSLSGLPNTLPPALFDAAAGRGPRPVDGRQRPLPGSTVSRQVTGQMPMPPIAKQFSGSGINVQRTQSPLRRQFTPPPPPAAPASTEIPWAINPQDKAKFDAHFADVDTGNKGFITGEEAVPFFSGSKLPEEALAQIWDLADIHKNGTLTREEFAIAMHLIRTERTKGTNGKGLPETLPLSYVPPAMRAQLGYGSPRAPQSNASSAFEPAPQPEPKSTYDDLFGLENSFTSASSAPTPISTAPQSQSALGFTTFPSSSELFGSNTKSPLAGSPSLFSSSVKPFSPSSGFGQSILQPTITGSSATSLPLNRGASPAQSHLDDLLGDNDPEVSRKLTSESTELANLSNQIGSLTKQTQDLKSKRTSTEQNLTNVTNQKHEIELKLAGLRQLYEKEEKDVKRVEEQLALTRNETNRLRNDYTLIEASLTDLRTRRAEVNSAYQSDHQENMALKEKIKAVNAEINTLKPELEKLRSEARQQKGLVAISKKQLTTAESERDRVKVDMETERKELTATQEILRKTSPQPPASPTLSQASAASNNPFSNPFHRTRSPPATQETAFLPSPFAPTTIPNQANQSAFENVFGSSFSSGNAAPAPPTSFSRQNTGTKEGNAPPSASSVSDGGAFGGSTPPTSPPTSNYSHQTEAPPPAIANQMTSAFLPLPTTRTDSTTSSVQVQPPSDAGFSRSETPNAWGDSTAEGKTDERELPGPSPLAASSSFGGSEPSRAIERTPTGSTTGGNAERAFSSFVASPAAVPGTFPGMDVVTPMNPIKPTATGDSYMSAASARSRGSQSKAEFGGRMDPFNFSKDDGRGASASKDDFDAAFADFGPPKAQERQLTGTTSIKRDHEFPPIEEHISDDSSDEASHADGFEDNFTPSNTERLKTAHTGEAAAVMHMALPTVQPSGPGTPLPGPNAQSSPPPYQATTSGAATETNPFPQEFTNLLPQRGDPTKTRTLSESSQLSAGLNATRFMASPLGTPGAVKPASLDPGNDVFASAVSDPARDVFNPSAPSTSNVNTAQYSAPVSHSPTTDFGAFKSQPAPKAQDDDFDDADFVNLSDAKEGDIRDESIDGFSHNDFDEFNAVFDSPGPSKPSTAMTNTTSNNLGEDDFESFHQNTGNQGFSSGATATAFAPQKTQTSSHDWDALFAGLGDKKVDQPSVPTKEPLSTAGSPITARAQTNGGGSSAATGGQAPTNEKLHELQDMGFSEDKASQALEKFDYNLSEATNYLLDMPPQR